MSIPITTITPAGVTVPAYEDVLEGFTAAYQSIYGADAYLDPDSQDGQWIGVISLTVSDLNNLVAAAYYAQSPATAQGAGLSSNVKINGLFRKVPTNSTVSVNVGGEVGTEIINGVVQDANNNLWNLPASVVIPSAGTITVTATAQQVGAINAPENTVNTIYNPQLGWQTVNNPISAAIAGAPVETDSQLRARQNASVAGPGSTITDAIFAAVDAVLPSGAQLYVFENATGTTNALGIPAHSICVVQAGGDDQAVANAIASRKPPGIQTYGTTSITVIDSQGVPSTINFYILTQQVVSVVVFLNPLVGYISSTGTLLGLAVAQWLNDLVIGTDSYVSKLYGPADLRGDAATTASAAVTLNGLPMTQQQLDALAATYNISFILQARPDMVVIGGPYTAGATEIHVTDASNFTIGRMLGVLLDNATWFTPVVTGFSSSVGVSFTPAIPTGRNIPNGSLVYTGSDIGMAFYESAEGVAANVTVDVL